MHILVFPTGMLLVRIKAPTENEMLALAVGLFNRPHRLFYQCGEFPICFIPALIRRVEMLRVCLYSGKGRSAVALGRDPSRSFQFRTSSLWIDFGHLNISLFVIAPNRRHDVTVIAGFSQVAEIRRSAGGRVSGLEMLRDMFGM
jgi:hypothetical protein